jgi:uncharacterized protein involved in exopolysaccharide biosynthesis
MLGSARARFRLEELTNPAGSDHLQSRVERRVPSMTPDARNLSYGSSPADESTPELADYLIILWRWKLAIIGGTLLAALLAFLISAVLPHVYRAEGTVVLVEWKVVESAPSRPGGDYKALHEIVRQLLVNPGSLAGIIQETPELHGSLPEDLARRLSTMTLAHSPVVSVSFGAGTPELAERLLARVLNRAVEMNTLINRQELTDSREYLKAQVDESHAHMLAAEEALLEFNRGARLLEGREMITVVLDRRRDLLQRLDLARAELHNAGAQAQALGKSLEGRREIVSLARSLVDDTRSQQLVRDRIGEPASSLTVQTEELHPAVLEVQTALAEALGKEAGARAEVQAIERQLAELDRELPARQTDLAQKESTSERLTREYELSKRTYQDFVRRYEEARVLVASRAPDLKILNPPAASSKPVYPRPLLNTAAAAVAGFILCVCLVFVVHPFLRRDRGREAALGARPLERVSII